MANEEDCECETCDGTGLLIEAASDAQGAGTVGSVRCPDCVRTPGRSEIRHYDDDRYDPDEDRSPDGDRSDVDGARW